MKSINKFGSEPIYKVGDSKYNCSDVIYQSLYYRNVSNGLYRNRKNRCIYYDYRKDTKKWFRGKLRSDYNNET